MCIRDSKKTHEEKRNPYYTYRDRQETVSRILEEFGLDPKTCLLYTSDAADERSSVDLGGRRIIKKKKRT